MMECVDYDELPLAPERILLHRSKIVNNFMGRILSTEYLLRVGDEHIKIRGQFDKRTDTISLITGKRK